MAFRAVQQILRTYLCPCKVTRNNIAGVYLSRRSELPYPETNVIKQPAKTLSELQKHLAPMEYDLTGDLIQTPPYGLNLMSVP